MRCLLLASLLCVCCVYLASHCCDRGVKTTSSALVPYTPDPMLALHRTLHRLRSEEEHVVLLLHTLQSNRDHAIEKAMERVLAAIIEVMQADIELRQVDIEIMQARRRLDNVRAEEFAVICNLSTFLH